MQPVSTTRTTISRGSANFSLELLVLVVVVEEEVVEVVVVDKNFG